MWKEGKRIRGQDGRLMAILSPLMTIPISYLVEFENGETRVVNFKHPEALAKEEPDIKTLEDAEAYVIQRLDGVFDRERGSVIDDLRRRGFSNAELIFRSAVMKRASEIHNKYNQIVTK